MNFARKNYYYYNTNHNKKGSKGNKDKEESQNLFNQKILDSIIDDDSETFSELISQTSNVSDINQLFEMTNYKFPKIMSNKPSYASLCAFFNSEKCLEVLAMLAPAGLESEQFQKTDSFGRSPIHFACAGGNLNIIRELDLAGFAFDTKDIESCQPSHYAAMAGHQNVIQYLWSKGVDILASADRLNSMTPLHIACLYGNLNVVKFICETVIGDDNDDNNQSDNSLTAKNSKLNKVLNFSNFHLRYCKTSTPLHLACEGGHADVLKYLLSKKDLVSIQINSLDRQSRTPILVACQNGSLECVKALISTGEVKLDVKKRKHLPLIDAAARGHLDIVQFLLKQKGVNIQRENSQKITAILAATLNDHIPIVKCLVENNALDKYDNSKIGSLFMSACGTNNYELVKYLDQVCNIPYKEVSHNRVYHWSYSHTLNLDENSTWGTQFMQQACLLENEQIVNLLLEKGITFDGIDLSFNTQKGFTPFMDFLIKKGFDILNCENSQGIPPIVSTIKKGNLKNVQNMINNGAKLDADIISKHDCILSACSNGNFNLYCFLMKYHPKVTDGEKCINECLFSYHRKNSKHRIKIAEDILKKGLADVNKPINDRDNSTLLTKAASNRSIEILDLFAEYGADFENVPLSYGQMSLKPYLPIFQYLADHGCKFNNVIKYKNFARPYYVPHFASDTPLSQSLYLIHSTQFEPSIPILLIDYLTDDEIKKIKEGQGNIVDKFLLFNCYEGILKLFKKCNSIVYPYNHLEDDFINRLLASGNQELVDFVCNNK